MDTARTGIFDVSPMTIAAGFAFTMLIGTFGWQYTHEGTISATNTLRVPVPSETSPQPYDALGELGAKTENAFSPMGTSILANAIVEYDNATKDGSAGEEGVAAVKKYAETIQPTVSYKTYTQTDFRVEADASAERVRAYRSDLQVALNPLLANHDYELDLFAQYVETKDPTHLASLKATIANYQQAIRNAERVVVPQDAVVYHIAILSSLSEFSATLQAMVDNATDPIASAVLLKSYLSAQNNMLASFNAIGSYAARKLL